MPLIEKEYEWIKKIVDGYDEVMLDEVLEDEKEIEIDLFPRRFHQDYHKKNNSDYLTQCEAIRKEIISRSNCDVAYDFDVENSWQFLYIIK